MGDPETGTVWSMFQHLQLSTTKHRVASLSGAVVISAAAAAALPPAEAAAVVAVAVLVGTRPHAPTTPRDHALRRHLATCLRREEGAFVLVASAPGRQRGMTAGLRISDSSFAEWRREGSVLVAVVDRHDVTRERITERLREKHGQLLSVGWATFPDDGATLDTLVDIASARMRSVSGAGAGLRALPATGAAR